MKLESIQCINRQRLIKTQGENRTGRKLVTNGENLGNCLWSQNQTNPAPEVP